MSLDEVEFDDVEENCIFNSSRAAIDDHIGARNNLTVLPPGKVQCPFHCRHGKRKCSSSWRVRASSASARNAIRSAGTTYRLPTCRPGGVSTDHQHRNNDDALSFAVDAGRGRSM